MFVGNAAMGEARDGRDPEASRAAVRQQAGSRADPSVRMTNQRFSVTEPQVSEPRSSVVVKPAVHVPREEAR
jgi:hypothetical protein